MTVTVDRVVEEFTAAPRKLFIDGQWTDAASGKTFETPNPATGETLANVAEGETPKTSTEPSAPPARRSIAARGAA
jgi:phenylacetaldehyde dehydrogenase